MSKVDHTLSEMVRKLERRALLNDADRESLFALPFHVRHVERGQYLARDGEEATNCCLILDGFVIRQKITSTGARQLLSIHIPGDLVDLERSLIRYADCNIQALTHCMVAFIPCANIRQIQRQRPVVAQAMWVDTLINAAVAREWIVNIGCRDAKGRIAHLLCEFGRRLELAGITWQGGFIFPMTQEHLGDAVGITSVHVNRSLKALKNLGLILPDRNMIRVADWTALCEIAGFSDAYLHPRELPA